MNSSTPLCNVSDVIRTHDLPLRRRTLYPAELQRHKVIRLSYIYYHKILVRAM